jgi:hypothetical protein
MQGNPLCVFVATEQMPASSSAKNEKTKWQAHAWLLFPGTTKYLLSESGKDQKDPGTPLNLDEDLLLFTSDQDRFVYYVPNGLDELFLLSEALFPDRAARRQDVEIRYGLIPAELYWNRRKTSGMIFYEKQEIPRKVSSFADGVLEGLRQGNCIYALWSPSGDFVYLQKETVDRERGGWFAAMHDRRGRWEETYDVKISEPPDPPSGERDSMETFQFDIRPWNVSGSLSAMKEIQTLGDPQSSEPQEGSAAHDSQTSMWASMQDLQEVEIDAPAQFLILKGSLIVGAETRAVHGMAMYPQGS